MIKLKVKLQEKFISSHQNRNGYLCLMLIEDIVIEFKFVSSRGREITSYKLYILLSNSSALCLGSFRETFLRMKRV